MTTDLSIIIVNYRVYTYLDACLHAVQQALHGIAASCWVVDNDTDPLLQQQLAAKHPWVHWICLQDNIGFAKANNLALKQTNSQYVLFLNPDTLVQEDTLKGTINYLTNQPTVGAVGIQMHNGHQQFLPESKRDRPTLMAAVFKLMGFAKRFPNSALFNRYALGHLDKDSIHAVSVLAGAFMMLPTDLAKKLGGFDEAFFMYGEDIDLSLRVLELGFNVHYLGHLKMTHFKGASSAQDPAYLAHFYGSMIIFVEKYPDLYGGPLGVWCLKRMIRVFWWIAAVYKKIN